MAVQVGGLLSLGISLPELADAGPESLPGTVNLVRNPSLESAAIGATDWAARGGATIARVTDTAWHGAAACRVTVPADVAGAGAQVATVSGLAWTGDRTLLGSVYVRGALPGLGLRLAGVYGDGSVGAGPYEPVPAETPDEWVRPVCAFAPDPEKALDALLLICDRMDGNLHPNGGFEADDLTGWEVYGGTLARDDDAFAGAKSLRASTGGAPTEVSAYGPWVTGLEPGEQYVVSAWVKAAPGAAVYFGYSGVSGGALAAQLADGGWQRRWYTFVNPADPPDGYVPNRARLAAYGNGEVRLDGVMLTRGDAPPEGFAQPGGTYWLDAAQVEEDRGYGATAFAIGQYGPPYHRWWGTEHLSPTVRDGIPLDARQAGRAGAYAIRATLWRSNADNDRLEDLSRYVIAGTVTADRSRDVSWSLTLRLMDEGWRRLRPWRDWLAPVLTVTDAAGNERSGQLGHYVVLPSAATHLEHAVEWDVDARSPEYLLSIQGFDGKLKIEENTRLTRAARWVLNSAALGEGNNGRPRFRLPDVDRRAKKDFEFTRKQSKLEIVNELLEAAACLPLFASSTGFLQSAEAKARSYRQRQPARLWVANFDPADARAASAVAGWVRRLPGSSNEVVGPVRALPRLGRAENRIVVASTDARRSRVRGEASIDDPSNPISVAWTQRRRTRRVNRRLIPDDASARELARAIAEEVGTRIDRVELTVAPDPAVDLLDEVVYLAIYRLDGGPAAVGRYRVLSAEYGFTPTDALVKLTLGFVHGVEELTGGVPLRYWDERAGAWRDDDGTAIVLNLA